MDRLRLVIFDLDGTLVDSQSHILASMGAAFDALSLTCPGREEVLSIVGLSLPQAMLRLAPEVPGDTRDHLVMTYKQAFHDLRKAGDPAASSPLYPGARAALERLAQQDEVLVALATGKSRRGTEAMLEAHGLGHHFISRQVADDHPSKPHPSMILTALSETGVAAGDAVMIGDTTYDMEMAANARITGLGVSWGYHAPAQLHAAKAVAVLEEFDGLDAALTELWQKV